MLLLSVLELKESCIWVWHDSWRWPLAFFDF